jgi:hypothetical protein
MPWHCTHHTSVPCSDLGRTLQYGVGVTGGMTIEKCLAACLAAKYTIAGVEYAGECWCDTQYRLGGGPAPDGDAQCNMACSGNSSELCGGPNRLAVWELASAAISTPPAASSTTTSATASASAPVSSSTSQWEYLGCYTDNVNTRTLRFGMDVGGQNNHENCQAACLKAGYAYSGTEYTAECYCDSVISNGGVKAADGEAGCNMKCQATTPANEICGGGGRLTLYHYTGTITAPPVNPPAGGGGGTTVSPATSGLPSTWAYRGCYMLVEFDSWFANSALTDYSTIQRQCQWPYSREPATRQQYAHCRVLCKRLYNSRILCCRHGIQHAMFLWKHLSEWRYTRVLGQPMQYAVRR